MLQEVKRPNARQQAVEHPTRARPAAAQPQLRRTAIGRPILFNTRLPDSAIIQGRETMATPFLSEIKIASFNFAPKGWALCNGQLLPINQNQALFSLLGTNYGGNGQTTFALPNLQGRVPLHRGNGFNLAQTGGEETHTLTTQEMPVHTHTAQGTSSSADNTVPTGNYLAAAQGLYGAVADTTTLHPATISNAGGGQPHENMQPYLVLNFCIALQGIFPSQN